MLKCWLETNCHRQTFVAEQLGVSRGYFSDLVNGKKKPSLDIALRIKLMTAGQVGLEAWFTASELSDVKVALQAAALISADVTNSSPTGNSSIREAV